MARKAMITIDSEVQRKVREFADGLGLTYDNTLLLLLEAVMHDGETPLQAGQRVRSAMFRSVMRSQREENTDGTSD